MKDTNFIKVIGSLVDFHSIENVSWKSEHTPNDTATVTFTGSNLQAEVTDDAENHFMLFSVYWEQEPDDPIYTDGCVEYANDLDSVECDTRWLDKATWDLFREINETIKQYTPRFA